MKEGWINFSDLYEHDNLPEAECVFVDPSYPLFLLGTSGSTGMPKLVQHSHVSLLIESKLH